MPATDLSASERIRRIKGQATAVSVANGVALPTGGSFDPVNVLRYGRSPYITETPGGTVQKPGCGCTLIK